MRCLQEVSYGGSPEQDQALAGKPRVDVASALRGLWA
jgi:hypothetical protein